MSYTYKTYGSDEKKTGGYEQYSQSSNYNSKNVEFCCGRGCINCEHGRELRKKWNFGF